MSAAELRLYQRSAYLFVLPVDVVGPLHRHIVLTEITAEDLPHGESLGLRQQKLPHDGDHHRMDEDGERKILARLTLPVIRALPASGRLVISHDNGHSLTGSRLVSHEIVVRTVDSRQMDNLLGFILRREDS